MSSSARFQEKKRLLVLGLFLFFLFSLLLGQFYKIQVIEGQKWAKQAKGQHQFIIQEPFMRGSFYAGAFSKKKGLFEEQILVMDVPRFHLYIDPDSLPLEQKEVIFEKILSFFPLKGEQKNTLKENFYKKSRSRKIIKWIEAEEKKKVLKWWEVFCKEQKIPKKALYFQLDYKRSYPFGFSLGQLLHTVQEEKEGKTFQAFPTGGLEMQFHPFLQGHLGKRIGYRSSRHALEMGPILSFAENGADVYLTINHYLQAICEEELKKGVEDAEAKGGWVFMMQPHTGEVLASAQYPFFHPEEYKRYYNDPDLLEHTKIKAVCELFEPGSIMKPLTLAVCLQGSFFYQEKFHEPLFTPEEKIATLDGSFPKTRFRLKDGRPRKYMNFHMALQKSGNIYLGKVVQRILENIGEKWYREAFIHIFGLGKKTQIEVPSEEEGKIPKPGRLHPNKRPEWSVPTPYSMAIGHNLLVNTAQMAAAFATLANGGFKIRPTLVRKIAKGKELIWENPLFSQEKERVLHKKVVEEVCKGLLLTTQLGGTSPRADIELYTVLGKSGTSEKVEKGQYSQEKYIASFVGFAPEEDPEFVLAVVLDEPKKKWIPQAGKNYHGGVSAAPIFRKIAGRSLLYLGVSPEKKKKKEQKERARECRRLYQEWNEN